MFEDFFPFSKPTITQAEIDEVIDCLKSGWITTGPRVQKLEQMLKDYLRAPQALAIASGTAALHLALLGFNLKPTDEVILPAMTFVASANTVLIAGAKPVFVDVDLNTYNLTPEAVEKAITKNTRVIMPVHFAGLPVDLYPIYDLAEKYHLRVLEDAAHAIGAEYQNLRIGSFGDTQIFSFHPNKNMTSGEGGCVTTRDEALAQSISVQRFHGIDRATWNRFSKSGSQHYDVIEPGFKYNMMDLQAAIAIHQLPKLNDFIAKRTALVKRYYSKLADWPEFTLPSIPDYPHKHAWHLFAPLINPEIAGMMRDEFITRMKDFNIGIGFHYNAVPTFTLYQKRFGYKLGDFPHAETIADRVMSLPLFPSMTYEDQDRVILVMRQVLDGGTK